MIFGLIGSSTNTPAPSLNDLIKLDCENPQELRNIGEAMNTVSYSDTLDKVFESLLSILVHVHENQIVHRDVKPGNFLVHNGTLILIDFGSAADLEPMANSLLPRRRGLEDGNRVAFSPIYCAPEMFIELNNSPTAFDIFSSALLFCQLLFSYLEERMDAGFHQQLMEAEWDLNVWLSNELSTKLRPRGLDHSLEYLANRPGLWTLLVEMLSEEPSKRPTAQQVIARFQRILTERDDEVPQDGPFFQMVIDSLETCEIPTVSRPLSFVATFSRTKSLGLVLSEVLDDDAGDDENDNDETNSLLWNEATKDAVAGEVFVKDVVSNSQAEELGIFQVGDRLLGIGELTFSNGGFEKAVEMLQDQPTRAKNIKLSFDRIRIRDNEAISMIPSEEVEIHIADLGAWSSLGKRKAQEDAFVLHEIHDTKDQSVLVAGILDGHGGKAASTMVSEELPTILSNQLLVNRRSLPEALDESWEIVCQSYRQQCAKEDECVADYDPREGILMANTGSKDLVAGTTASIMALDEKTGKLTILNCGDSRSMVINSKGKAQFVTKDHTPQTEQHRLQEGTEAGLDYSLPQCRLSRWFLSVGDYEYAVGRSLEGQFATSKGIVSDPDVSTILVEPAEILLSASDGLWEVMDSSEVAMDLSNMRKEEISASDAARTLCSMAIKKGTSDNVSAVVVFL